MDKTYFVTIRTDAAMSWAVDKSGADRLEPVEMTAAEVAAVVPLLLAPEYKTFTGQRVRKVQVLPFCDYEVRQFVSPPGTLYC